MHDFDKNDGSADAARYEARADLVTTVEGGEAVVVDLHRDAYFTLSRTATLVWEALSSGRDLDTAVTHILAEFDVDPTRARADAEAFRDALLGSGILVTKQA